MKIIGCIIALLVLVLIISNAISSPEEQRLHEVYGTLFCTDGRPAADVKIGVFDSNTSGNKSTITDSKGNYRISVLGIDTSFSAESGDSVLYCEFSIPKGSPEELRKDLRFERAILVSGKVTDRENGAPISGAQVTVSAASGKQTVTKANGGFKAYVIPRAEMSLDIYSPDYVAQKIQLTALNTTTGIHIKLFHGGSVSGRVVDQNGRPVAGINLSVGYKSVLSTQTDGTGNYEIQNVDPRKRLRVYVSDSTMSIDEGKTFKFPRHSKNAITNFVVKLPVKDINDTVAAMSISTPSPIDDSDNNPTSSKVKTQITGKVIDAQTGIPITNFKVKWAVPRSVNNFGNESILVDDPNGRFVASVDNSGFFDPDRVTVRVMAGGYISEEKSIELNKGWIADYSNLFKLKKSISTRGLITDSSGKGVPGAKVVVLEDSDYHYSYSPTWMSWKAGIQIFTTDPDGHFVVNPVVMRSGTIVIKKPGYPKIAISSVDLTQPITIALPKSSVLTVKAPTLADQDFWISLAYGIDGSITSKQIPHDGRVIFPDLRPGKYTLTASNTQGKFSFAVSVNLEPGQHKTIKMENRYKVRANIRFTRNQKPVSNVSVVVNNKDGSIGTSAYTDARGECHVGLARPGLAIMTYFRMQSYPFIEGQIIPLKLHSGNNTIEIKLPTGRISGRLIDAKTLEPIKGAIINCFTKRRASINYLYDEPYRGNGFSFWYCSAPVTSMDGAFRLNNLPSGNITLTCTSLDSRTTYIGNTVTLSEKKPVKELILKFIDPGKLHVSLVDSVSGKTLRAMPVVLFTLHHGRIFPDENYEKPTPVPAGKYILWVRPDDGKHFQAKTLINVESGNTTNVTIKLNPAAQRIVFSAAKGGRFEALAWPDKPATAFQGYADAPSVNDMTYMNSRPWIGYVIKDADTRKPVLTGPNGPEWGGYLPGFNINRIAAIPIKPGNYLMQAVLRNTTNRAVLSGDNLWKMHKRFTVVAGKDTVIDVK